MAQLMKLDSNSVDVVLFGGNGYVGQAFRRVMDERGIKYFAPESQMLNLLHVDSINFVLKSMVPSFVINCAGYTGKPNVDTCEIHKEDTTLGNINTVFNLAQICDELDIPWGHVSSGCIYNGYEKIFTEEDPPNFTSETGGSHYSDTKASAEKLLTNGDFNCYIWRLRIPFDEFDSPRNYLSKLQKYDILLDLENSISHREEFVKACLDTWASSSADYGIYNIVNSGSVKASSVVELINKHLPFEKRIELMDDVERFYAKVNAVAPRSNCVLSNEKLLSCGINMRDAHEAVEDSLINWKKHE